MSTTRVRVLAIAVGCAALGGSVLLVPAASSAATPCAPLTEQTRDRGSDVDGDFRHDISFPTPSRPVAGKANAGAVLVTSCARTVLLTSAEAALGAPQAGGRFGSQVIASDVDRDGLTDLIISAPGQYRTGAVGVVHGSPQGIGRGKPSTRITVPGLRAGDRFGASMLREAEANRLSVGAPGTEVGRVKDAGAVHRIRLLGNAATVVSSSRLVQGGSGGANQAERGDHFGEVLSVWPAADYERPSMAVGVPREDIGKRKDAGAVVIVSDTGRKVTVSQNSKGIPGTAEAGDLFGAAVIVEVIGVPGEGIGSAKHAGAIQYVKGGCRPATSDCPTGFRGSRVLSQDTPGVVGSAETGDRLGSSLSWVSGINASYSVVAGVPGEDAGKVVDAGALTGFWPGNGCGRYVCRTWGQPGGGAERGDRFGASLSGFTENGSNEEEDDEYTVLYAGAPGEDVGGRRDAGASGPRWGTVTGERLGEVAPVF